MDMGERECEGRQCREGERGTSGRQKGRGGGRREGRERSKRNSVEIEQTLRLESRERKFEEQQKERHGGRHDDLTS